MTLAPQSPTFAPGSLVHARGRDWVVLPPGEDPDVLLAMAGKISADLRSAILSRPQLFAELIRSIKSIPDHAVLRIVRDVRDGNW